MEKKNNEEQSFRANVQISEADDTINKRLIGLFLFGCVIFNYPILSLFNADIFILGIPFLYFYIFGAWFLFVLVLKSISTVYHEKDQGAASHRESDSKGF